MVQLSERLKAIAGQVVEGKTAADIGTDHALVPIYLLERGLVPRTILSDSREGPLQKACKNLSEAGIALDPGDLRKGDGLRILENGEAATVIIAGMGGLLITGILSDDLYKSLSFERLVLQPRTAAADLRRWLTKNGFMITRDQLTTEGRRQCEVITAEPRGSRTRQDLAWTDLDYEISPLLIQGKDPGIKRFIEDKIRESRSISRCLESSRDPDAQEQIGKMKERIRKLVERKALL
jgi:tRNA (adenine22-N1)-methyltransferase